MISLYPSSTGFADAWEWTGVLGAIALAAIIISSYIAVRED